jgi:hypothetical protein
MRYLWLLLLCLCLRQPCWSDSRVVEEASRWLWVRESGHNAGREVEMFQRSVGLRAGQPWCAAFVSYVLDAVGASKPRVRSGLAQKFIVSGSVPAKHVAKGYRQVEPGWLVVWKRGDTYGGHIGIVERWSGISGETIEGNVRQGNKEGVFRKKRAITDGQWFRITHFTKVEY